MVPIAEQCNKLNGFKSIQEDQRWFHIRRALDDILLKKYLFALKEAYIEYI